MFKKPSNNQRAKPYDVSGAYHMKPKDLIGIPWMLAFALRDDGWWLRSDIIWHKRNTMPESVTDRPTKSHEYIFLLSKSQKYYYDADAIKEPAIPEHFPRYKYKFWGEGTKEDSGQGRPGNASNTGGKKEYDGLRNKRSVWSITTKPYSGAHFAVYPRELIVPCILAGSKPGDIVLDPFGGSGTTAVTAQELGRDYITIELNKKYVDEIIRPRLAATCVPLPLGQ